MFRLSRTGSRSAARRGKFDRKRRKSAARGESGLSTISRGRTGRTAQSGRSGRLQSLETGPRTGKSIRALPEQGAFASPGGPSWGGRRENFGFSRMKSQKFCKILVKSARKLWTTCKQGAIIIPLSGNLLKIRNVSGAPDKGKPCESMGRKAWNAKTGTPVMQVRLLSHMVHFMAKC